MNQLSFKSSCAYGLCLSLLLGVSQGFAQEPATEPLEQIADASVPQPLEQPSVTSIPEPLGRPVATSVREAEAAPSALLPSLPVPRRNEALETDAAVSADAAPIASAPGDPWGDSQGLALISLRVLFQTRYSTTFASPSQSSRESYRVREDYLVQHGDGWDINRALLRVSSEPLRYLGFRMVLDFAELIANNPEAMVKQAYTSLRPVPERLEFMVGLFKVPFSILELDPSSRYEFASMGPANRLLGDLGFAGRDLGAQVVVAPFRKPKRLRLYLGAFRGHSYDEHDLPAGVMAGRVETEPNKHLRFGAGWVEHLRQVTYNRPFNSSGKDELPNPPDPLYPNQKRWQRGRAWGVDARFKRKGFMARGEWLYGDRLDVDTRYDAQSFWSAMGIAAYRIDAGSVRLIPAIRAEWLDADREHRKGVYRTLSLSLSALLLERVRIMVDVTRTDVESQTVLLKQPKPLQQQPYLALDNTRLVVQLQLEL